MQHDLNIQSNKQIIINNILPETGEKKPAESIYAGLNSSPKYIPSKYFYDAAGSKLFEEITSLPEYYITRLEKQILQQFTEDQCKDLHDADIIELGSGDCSKISIILNAIPSHYLESVRYIPVDFCHASVKESATRLTDKFRGLKVQGLVADFTEQFDLITEADKRIICFLGSTLGNLSEDETEYFFYNTVGIMQPGDTFLLGVDMVKPANIIERAYNDSKNITARFNRNILNAINDLSGTNFNPDEFEHVAFYSEKLSRVEMHLKATKEMEIQSIQFPDKINIEKDEMIHTENSKKYSIEFINNLVEAAGLRVDQIYSDKSKWFSLFRISKKYKT